MKKPRRNRKYVFVVGGVMSGVGKGIASASIGKILQSRGFEVTAIKIDPYVNVDAGTMNPTEHGEVFVLNDGTECDQDMGNYERFLDRNLSAANYMTTGSIYKTVIERERGMGYGGRSVSVVPYIPLEVIRRIENAAALSKADVTMIEIGGTVGEYENILFLEAVRMMRIKHPEDIALILVSHLPIVSDENELKTKPTQHAVRALNSVGLQPDIILARAKYALDEKRKEKIAFNCSLRAKDVISAPDAASLYDVPINFEKDNLGNSVLEKLKIRPPKKDLKEWRVLADRIRNARETVKIGIVGKYFSTGKFILADSYISVIESIKHAASYWGVRPEIRWLDSEEFERSTASLRDLEQLDGVIVPGGFGARGVEGKLNAIRYCRENKIPYLGLCYGMQLAVVEFARNVLKMKGANTTEIDPKTRFPVIDILPEQKKLMEDRNYGGTMRLGAYPAVLAKGTMAEAAYGTTRISERHRHRYEVNPAFIKKIEKSGMTFSGRSPDRRLMEVMELPRESHPFFMGSQFHPEFTSHPLKPNPLFREFMKAASARASVSAKAGVAIFGKAFARR
ncbi:MAG TPA: CTP synthase [Candidatus Paceibacterota bacterium]|nr:CTP synthase [Candidatus Paceibacterota bacterium]